jgi:beta-lactam-binding protein with PASTA domain
MSFVKFLTSRIFILNILLAIVFGAILIFSTLFVLKSYTRHGEANPVPDFIGLSLKDAQLTADQHNLKINVIDSLYVDNFPPGAVVDQVPDKNHKVKNNRTIFLTVNSTQPEMVSLPKLTDISFRQAQVLIENSGLEIGQITYQPSEYNDLVLNVQIDSVDIFPGNKLEKGSSVDLTVGQSQGNTETPLPDLIGLTKEQAEQSLTDSRLNTGVIIFDQSILTKEDSIKAVVWRQRPNPQITGMIDLGSSVDLWITVDELKIEEALNMNF